MKTRIEISDYKKIGKGIYKSNSLTIKEVKYDGYFLYYNQDTYLGRYNSEIGLFEDGIIVIVLDSEYE